MTVTPPDDTTAQLRRALMHPASPGAQRRGLSYALTRLLLMTMIIALIVAGCITIGAFTRNKDLLTGSAAGAATGSLKSQQTGTAATANRTATTEKVTTRASVPNAAPTPVNTGTSGTDPWPPLDGPATNGPTTSRPTASATTHAPAGHTAVPAPKPTVAVPPVAVPRVNVAVRRNLQYQIAGYGCRDTRDGFYEDGRTGAWNVHGSGGGDCGGAFDTMPATGTGSDNGAARFQYHVHLSGRMTCSASVWVPVGDGRTTGGNPTHYSIVDGFQLNQNTHLRESYVYEPQHRGQWVSLGEFSFVTAWLMIYEHSSGSNAGGARHAVTQIRLTCWQ